MNDLNKVRELFAAVDAGERAAAERGGAETREARRILDRVHELLAFSRRANARRPRVHLLAALNRECDERLHCNLLRWLLDPVETHGYGEAFLLALLRECALDVAGENLTDAEALCEVRGIDSRIDVEVSQPGMFLLHIEAKIDHVERDGQTLDETADMVRRCAAKDVPADHAQPIYLTRGGLSPSAEHDPRIRPWLAFTWQQIASALRGPLRARRHAQTALIEHVLDMFEMLTRGGTMEPFKPDELDRLLIDNWDKVTRLAEARDRLGGRVRATFTKAAFANALESSSFAEWELSVHAGHKYDAFYIAPEGWPRDGDYWTCFGFENVTVESLLATRPEDGPAVCFFWQPLRRKNPRVDDETERLRSLVAKHLPKGVALDGLKKNQPVQWRPRLDFRAHPERIPDLAKLVVEEWERMAPLVPEIDALIPKASRTRRT